MFTGLFDLKGAFVLVELKALTKAGDVEGFALAMRKWEAVRSVRWAKLSWSEYILWGEDDVPNKKAVILHRVLITAAETGQVDIAKILIRQYGCIVCTDAVTAAFKREQWEILELFLQSGWDINDSVQPGTNMYPTLRYVTIFSIVIVSSAVIFY
jgi:hypothetical protein